MSNQLQLQMKDFVQVVSFKLHEEEYAIEITKAKEIILVEGVTRVPQMPDFIEGIINLRGNVIPVIDLRKRFGLPVSALDEQSRIVVTRMESKIIGLIVDSVSQVMKVPKSQIQEPPETIAGLAGEYLLGIGRVEERMILLLDTEKILKSNEEIVLNSCSQPQQKESGNE
ncbi:hypothetical protein BVY04_03330 [bacterium M21]|nr:hypothetical protein BVY04_03330 [bacterium M21]